MPVNGDQLSGKDIVELGKGVTQFLIKLHNSHIPQTNAPLAFKIFEVRWGKSCHFLKLV